MHWANERVLVTAATPYQIFTRWPIGMAWVTCSSNCSNGIVCHGEDAIDWKLNSLDSESN